MTTRAMPEVILKKAAGLFADRGFAGCSIRDIGDAAGITSAALYYHFRNKDDLLLSIILRGLEKVSSAVAASIENVDTALDRLRIAARTHLKVCLENREAAAVIFKETRHLGTKSGRQVAKLRQGYEKLWDDLILAAAQEHKVGASVDLRLFRLMLLGSLNSVLTWYQPSGRYGPEHIADHFLNFTMNGVRGVAQQAPDS